MLLVGISVDGMLISLAEPAESVTIGQCDARPSSVTFSVAGHHSPLVSIYLLLGDRGTCVQASKQMVEEIFVFIVTVTAS